MASPLRFLAVLAVASAFGPSGLHVARRAHQRTLRKQPLSTSSSALARCAPAHLWRRDHDGNDGGAAQSSAPAGVAAASALASLLLLASPLGVSSPALAVTDTAAIGKCVLTQCQPQLAKCVLSPKCFANLICINTCSNRPDETECQIKCGDLFENQAAGEFNACAVSQKKCVPQRADDFSYPIPPRESIVKSFDPTVFDGRWYISSGLNPLFDIFDCQVHFFVGEPAEPARGEPARLFGKLNWRIEAPDGESYDKQAIQTFVQDAEQPGVLYNHDNEYLHYQDDWYILDYADTADQENGFVLVYYRGNNDAWDGYGGAVVYTRSPKLPESLKPRLAEACKRAGIDFAKFKPCDNACGKKTTGEVVALRERYAGKLLQTAEGTLQSDLTVLRSSAGSGLTAGEKGLVSAETKLAKAEAKLAKQFAEFEKSAERAVENEIAVIEKVEKVIERDVIEEEKSIMSIFSKPSR